MISFVDAGAPILLLHPLAPSAHLCEYHPGSLRSLRDKSSVRHSPQAVEIPLCLHHKRHSSDKYYFINEAKPLHLVVNLPDTGKNKSQGDVMLFST